MVVAGNSVQKTYPHETGTAVVVLVEVYDESIADVELVLVARVAELGYGYRSVGKKKAENWTMWAVVKD